MFIIRILILAFLASFAPELFAMNADQKKIEEKPSYVLKAQDLDVYSPQNKALKVGFNKNDVLNIAGLRDLIFAYHGPEWVYYKTLSTNDWVTRFSGYPPVTSLRLNNDKTQLTAYVDHVRNLLDSNHFKPSKIVWNVTDGSYHSTVKKVLYKELHDWSLEQSLIIKTESAHEQFKATLINADGYDYDDDKTVAASLTATVEVYKLALLRAILASKPEDESEKDDTVLIQFAKATGLGSMFGANLEEIIKRKK